MKAKKQEVKKQQSKQKPKAAKVKAAKPVKATHAKPAKELKKKVDIEVELPLSDKEKVKRGQLACQLLNEKADIEIEKKKANDQFKEEMHALGSRAHKLLREFETGREKRTVSATEIRNFAKNVVEYSYGGHVVKTRPMTEADRQDELPLRDKKSAPATPTDAKAGKPPVGEKQTVGSSAPTPPAGDPSLQTQLPLTAPLGQLAGVTPPEDPKGKVCGTPEGKPNPKALSETQSAIADEDIAATMRDETSRRGKSSAVDGPRA